MLRQWCARAAARIARWCLGRADAWVHRGMLMSDLSEWFEGRETWRAIRKRTRAGEGDE